MEKVIDLNLTRKLRLLFVQISAFCKKNSQVRKHQGQSIRDELFTLSFNAIAKMQHISCRRFVYLSSVRSNELFSFLSMLL